jgi:Uma2 family endonuclease
VGCVAKREYRISAMEERATMAIEVSRKTFTTDEYDQMIESGVLTKEDRVELIEGEIVDMSPIGRFHAACVDRLNAVLSREVGQKLIVRVQGPIRLSMFSEPQPDVALLKLKADFYAEAHPSPADVYMVVEVADTSIGYDRATKVPLYARAGIPEMWLVDLAEEKVSVFWAPRQGEYKKQKELRRGEYIVSSAVRDLVVAVDDILGPASPI